MVDAQAFVQDDVVVIGRDGKPIERPTAPTEGGTINDGELSVWKVVSGRRPSGPPRWRSNGRPRATRGSAIGDTVKLNANGGSREFTLVGIVAYNDIASPGDGTWALFDAPTARSFVAGPASSTPCWSAATARSRTPSWPRAGCVGVLDPDVSREPDPRRRSPPSSRTRSSKALGFVTVFLSIFSFVALGVGAFVIYNVFSITTAQRQRENALLRAIGASRRQVTTALLVEATVIGLLGSLVGLVGGVGLAVGVRKLLDALGLQHPGAWAGAHRRRR